jgi:hypothetical protein
MFDREPEREPGVQCSDLVMPPWPSYNQRLVSWQLQDQLFAFFVHSVAPSGLLLGKFAPDRAKIKFFQNQIILLRELI